MSRNIWIGIVVIIIFVAGGWWYLNQSHTPATSNTTPLSTGQTTEQGVNTRAQSAPHDVTIDQASLVASFGNPVLSGQAGTITKGSDLYVSVYNADGKVWGSGNIDPILSNGRWSIQIGAPDTSFKLPPGTYTVYVGDPRTPFATGILKIGQ